MYYCATIQGVSPKLATRSRLVAPWKRRVKKIRLDFLPVLIAKRQSSWMYITHRLRFENGPSIGMIWYYN